MIMNIQFWLLESEVLISGKSFVAFEADFE